MLLLCTFGKSGTHWGTEDVPPRNTPKYCSFNNATKPLVTCTVFNSTSADWFAAWWGVVFSRACGASPNSLNILFQYITLAIRDLHSTVPGEIRERWPMLCVITETVNDNYYCLSNLDLWGGSGSRIVKRCNHRMYCCSDYVLPIG